MSSPSLAWIRSAIGLLFAGGGAALAADPALEQGLAQPGLTIAAVQAAGPAAWSNAAATDGRLQAALSRSSFSLIELPQEGPPGSRAKRPRRALSFRSETPQRMLRTIGVEASDCYTRLRVPTRVTRDETTGDRDVRFAAHVGFACKF